MVEAFTISSDSQFHASLIDSDWNEIGASI